MFSNKQSQYEEQGERSQVNRWGLFFKISCTRSLRWWRIYWVETSQPGWLGRRISRSGSSIWLSTYHVRLPVWHTTHFLERLNQLSSHAASQLHREPAHHTE